MLELTLMLTDKNASLYIDKKSQASKKKTKIGIFFILSIYIEAKLSCPVWYRILQKQEKKEEF